MVFIFKLSPNDQQVPGKLLNISRKWPGMLTKYNTQLNLNKHSYNKVDIFVCCCHTLWLKGQMGADFWILRCPQIYIRMNIYDPRINHIFRGEFTYNFRLNI